MRPALLLVDLQADFLDRPGLVPAKAALTEQCARLLMGCRALGVPVLHAHTLVRADGSDRMPHWKRSGYWACVEETPGSRPPPALAPAGSEPIVGKTAFSAFGNPGFEARLRELGADTLILAGIYLHSCVRATALDAYGRGFDVWIVSDAVGSTEPLHAAVSRRYLEGRAASFLAIDAVLTRLGSAPRRPRRFAGAPLPVACIGGEWRRAADHPRIEKRNPARWDEVLGEVPMGGSEEVGAAAAMAAAACGPWRQMDVAARHSLLESWADRLSARSDALAGLLAREAGKPICDARAEIGRAVALIATACRVAADQGALVSASARGVWARRRPHGVVALITPWNNPVAIPVGKLAPALAFGNTVVWKPSWQAPRTAVAVMESLLESGFPEGAVNMVMGDAETAWHMILEPAIAAVSLTGSQAAGQQASALCAQVGKPLQAELGGNNAAVVLPDCDLVRFAPAMAMAAFGFAGQRCTATRRFIVLDAERRAFEDALTASVEALRLGPPESPATQVGPMISMQSRARVQDAVDGAVAHGARILCGGKVPEELGHGCWYRPTLLGCDDPKAAIVREETFGPVAVIQTAPDFDAALALANAVPQGLVTTLYGEDRALQSRFAERAEAGVLRLNETEFGIDPDAPFGGWKASGMGPPEHGIWDREFYSRAQAVYGFDADTAG
jgi:acyl-CoA reductase-like NAD-dependent aldehyde dehydrogenase/nicotinamidase-related amidase